jgi:cytoskeletal protein RodZ
MKILSLVTAIGLGLAVSVGAQQYGQQQQPQQQQPTEDQQQGTISKGQTTDQPAGPTTGHSKREQMKDTSKPTKMKSGGTATTNTGKSQTNVNQTTTVNKQEFKSRHSEVFSLGRHPKEFFVQQFGSNHVRLIGNTYFAFVDGCWVSVDVDGFVYSERVICPGDPEFIAVE